jgi:hypothetical protein
MMARLSFTTTGMTSLVTHTYTLRIHFMNVVQRNQYPWVGDAGMMATKK